MSFMKQQILEVEAFVDDFDMIRIKATARIDVDGERRPVDRVLSSNARPQKRQERRGEEDFKSGAWRLSPGSLK